MTHLIATFFRVGHMRPAPGTWGSLAALPFAWALHMAGGFPLLAIATVLVFGLGWWATAEETRDTEDHDPSEIVIDEVVGQWIAIWPVSFGAAMMGVDVLRLYPGWIAGFVLFRLFDIWKPWLVGWADRRGDALGVMLDDVIAGVFAAVVSIILAGLSHGLLM
ncbi:phosphatidylglycerophosphatase A family protein [Pseudoprimorskyibacter insulae]|uniref:Phosphatidylglycerophosphatase A n=1 Tax=Pseudoprimorskyibacter insulae TaxID=1695997 RepID=A0A2R8AWV1_9RHOB|nr:phosphatidylglycerophosphatase A [Pseudoprimorskyibacter insulae]SPF80417.1 Phosphatidylglycerophosphatase A [Pseudoprimorskyibacter insulae]